MHINGWSRIGPGWAGPHRGARLHRSPTRTACPRQALTLARRRRHSRDAARPTRPAPLRPDATRLKQAVREGDPVDSVRVPARQHADPALMDATLDPAPDADRAQHRRTAVPDPAPRHAGLDSDPAGVDRDLAPVDGD